MSYLKKSILYLVIPPILVISFSIWIGATIKTDGLTPDEASIKKMEEKPVITETKKVSSELKPIRDIFSIKKQMELPPISEILPQPAKEKQGDKKEIEDTKQKIEKIPHNLMLILIMEDKKIAMIDGKTLKEGDALADNSIIRAIETDKVLLINGGSEEWLFIR
ncbi:MAG: hypothetical protein HZC45_01495 [Deltaproteobacteria bacterium]|nr:hypothetical protein [Deltaproteobacteria bacterium]